jgi:hypothetical protein
VIEGKGGYILSQDSGLEKEQEQAFQDESPEAGIAAGRQGEGEYNLDRQEQPQGFLEIVYGVLFEPVKTMQRAAENPPLLMALVIVTLLSLLGTLMGYLALSRVLSQGYDAGSINQLFQGARALVPIGACIALVFSFFKWFAYSAALHLAADLLGGRGRARGVFAAAGLADLPYILLIPFQLLGYWYGIGNTAVNALLLMAGLSVWIWRCVLLVIGIREGHGLSTGRSVLVFFIPYLALFLLFVLSIIALVVMAASLPSSTNIPGYF